MPDEQGIIRTPGMARTIDLGAFAVTVHADLAETGGAFSLLETGESVIGAGPPLHVHRDCAETFYVLAGSYVMIVAEREVLCRTGSVVIVPSGTTHTFKCAEAGSRKLNLYTPAAMVGYFDELAAGIAAGMDASDLEAIAGRYAMDVVGEVPDGYLQRADDRAPDRP